MKKLDRTGVINKNKYGSTMEIIEYINANDIWVKFETGNLIHTTWGNFIKGEVTNVYDKSVCGLGFIGEGIHKISANGKKTKVYETWGKMLQRCYDDKVHEKQSTYKGCSVISEWYNFQNFAAWFDENYYEVEGELMQLDKDILFKRNKIYSPEKCIFVPERINKLFIKSDASRGNYPIGVCYHKVNDKYIAKCNVDNGNRKYLGSFNSSEEAFYAYKTFKEKYIKEVADEYRSKIPSKLFNVMINYQVELND